MRKIYARKANRLKTNNSSQKEYLNPRFGYEDHTFLTKVTTKKKDPEIGHKEAVAFLSKEESEQFKDMVAEKYSHLLSRFEIETPKKKFKIPHIAITIFGSIILFAISFVLQVFHPKSSSKSHVYPVIEQTSNHW